MNRPSVGRPSVGRSQLSDGEGRSQLSDGEGRSQLSDGEGRSRLSAGVGRRLDNHPAYWAFVLHRFSGVVLALFLPAHFYVLALAIEGEGRLDAFLSWADDPWVKVSEAALMVLLAAHMTGGLRLLAVEFLPWRDWQKTLIACALGAALLTGAAFLANAV